jgi:hypothetical protein
MSATRISGTEVSEGTPRTVALVSTQTTTPKTVSNTTTATTHGLRVRTSRFYALAGHVGSFARGMLQIALCETEQRKPDRSKSHTTELGTVKMS